ncbi:ATP-binding protein [Thioalkalivibrio sp.]|uniref:ATP-binding protein n=1 Tax=Thioalkalivibrio sp. TaxID=2093813 RepID=UPI00356617E1
MSSSGSGTGLGLAMVANVMREHDGEARYESPPAGGARFVLSFPESPRGAAGE